MNTEFYLKRLQVNEELLTKEIIIKINGQVIKGKFVDIINDNDRIQLTMKLNDTSQNMQSRSEI